MQVKTLGTVLTCSSLLLSHQLGESVVFIILPLTCVILHSGI